jgi:hypothetical protein
VQNRLPGASGQFICAGQVFVTPLQLTSHLHEFAQLTVPHADSAPMQVAEHAPVPQFSVPHAAAPPEQVSVQSPVVQLRLPHAPAPVQVAVQSPLVHVMLPHACVPVHVTLQSFVLHVMPLHAPSAVHSIVHASATVHVIEPHAPDCSQRMWQFQPAGQVMLPLPAPTIVQVPAARSQPPLQIAGHVAVSGRPASNRGFVPAMQ